MGNAILVIAAIIVAGLVGFAVLVIQL